MSEAKNKNKIIAIIAAVAVAVIGVVVALVLILARPAKGLLGEWIDEDSKRWTYNFGEESKGTYSYGTYSQGFTYTDNGDSLTITYDGATASMTLNYRIEDNKLIIVDSFGEDTVYVRK